MGKTRGVHETTPELRNRMVGMYEAGLGLREIAAAVNCSQRTVKRWLNRFDKEGTVETRERCGRKRATTVEQDEAIVRLATQTTITAAKAVLPALGLTCSVDTVRERLHKAGIHNWSPSRKYMQRIPLGEADGAAIQQAVWRPTGTQLGKKKSGKDVTKNEKTSPPKKKSPKKAKPRDLFIGDGAPAEGTPKQSTGPQDFAFSQQAVRPPEVNEISPTVQPPVHPSQTEFTNALSLAQQQPQNMYQHPSMNISQNWPLDLGHGSHQYPQNQQDSLQHEHPSTQLSGLHPQPDQSHHVPQLQQGAEQIQQTVQDPTLPQAQSHHHDIEQQQTQLQMEQVKCQIQQSHRQEQPQQDLSPALSSPHTNANLNSESSNSSNSQESLESHNDDPKRTSRLKSVRVKSEQPKRKKKGGKAKGTLETSVEIRNRMIGMAEAGLSTLSIALAIDRSERTVKRWLERWHKEGNVQTKERKGRRRITTKEQDEAIVAMATQHPLTAAKHVAPALGLKCSVDTIRERLHKAGIHSWKLGKKQGEGNAVHTVHLWQPSGNRPNKPKMPGEKKKKRTSGNKKREQCQGNGEKRISRRRKIETQSPLSPQPAPSLPTAKLTQSTANMLIEQPPPATTVVTTTVTIPYHNPASMANYASTPNMMPLSNMSTVPGPTLVQNQSTLSAPAPQPQSIQPMEPIMQQRPDCRLASTIVAPPPVSVQGNTVGLAYSSCMVGSSSHAGHMEQAADPLNYEPYIWSF